MLESPAARSHHTSALQSASQTGLSAEVKPHHAGEAYSNEATVVVLATRCSCDGWRPWDLSFLSAKIEEAEEDIIWSRGTRIMRCEVTNTPRDSTRSAPGMVLGQNGTDKMVWTKWYTDKMVLDKM